MARQKYRNVVRDAQGDAVAGASVEVRNSAGGLATLYAADTGATTLLNPLTAGNGTGEVVGGFEFWIDEADYGDFSVTVGAGASADTFPIRVDSTDKSFTSRPLLADHIAKYGIIDGAEYRAAGLSYLGETGATAIADLLGLVPGGTPTLGHFPDTTAGIADALAYAAGREIDALSLPAGALPSSYTATLDYKLDADLQLFTLASAEPRTAKRMIRTQHAGAHPDASVYSFGIESRPTGSGKNGPTSADVGFGVSVIKKGFGTATRPPAGEIDGLYIVVRQDGPQGTISDDVASSDAAGILVDAQTVGDAGFISVSDCQSSQIDATTFELLRRMQVQSGVIIANAAGGPVSYGYTATAKTGTLDHAFYVGEAGGQWLNLFKAPNKLTIDSNGSYNIQTPDWTSYAARFSRTAGINDALSITQRGTGGIAISTVEAGAITFATSNTSRWQIAAAGTLQPVADLGANLGAVSRQVGTIYANQIILSGNNQQMNNLPVYADNTAATGGGLAAGRVYRTATGELRIVV